MARLFDPSARVFWNQIGERVVDGQQLVDLADSKFGTRVRGGAEPGSGALGGSQGLGGGGASAIGVDPSPFTSETSSVPACSRSPCSG
ncbi:hypothetical protein [Pseudonocardia sp. GCM10023141]|uniref:hypothetical protein n=1 Tax=Pseudonocardia sp. GCM10023141 TaxID=3252653 RepID=UPI00361809B8